MTALLLHCSVAPPIVSEIEPLVAALAEPISIIIPAKTADQNAEVCRLFHSVVPVEGNFTHSALVEQAAFSMHSKSPFSRILSTGELGVLRAARLRQALGIPGQSVASALAYRDKVAMKNLCAEAGIRVPRFQAVDGPSDLLGFVRSHGLPVVLKPRSGSGSVNTWAIHTEDELATIIRRLHAESDALSIELMVEEFIHGRLYNVNGYANADRTIGLMWPASYVERGNLQSVTPEQNINGDYLLGTDDELVGRLSAFSSACLRALPWPRDGFVFHLEAFEEERSGELVFCEVACRPGGGTIVDMYGFAFGVNLSEVSLLLQAGLPVVAPPRVPNRLTGGYQAPVRQGLFTLAAVHPPPWPWLLRHDARVQSGTTTGGPRSCADSSADFVVEGGSVQEVLEHIFEVSRWFESVASWDNGAAV